MTLRLDDVAGMRKALGKSQRQLADLVGVSIRAVQSYEQGWRTIPAYVTKLTSLMLFLKWRETQHHVKPCWELRQCAADIRARCFAYQHRAGEYCWLVNGTWCAGKPASGWDEKVATCQKCSVVNRWLNGRAEKRPTHCRAGS